VPRLKLPLQLTIGSASLALGAAPNDEILRQRYGVHGTSVCVEFEVQADLLEGQLNRVQYPAQKCLHVDEFLRAFVDHNSVKLALSNCVYADTAREPRAYFTLRQRPSRAR